MLDFSIQMQSQGEMSPEEDLALGGGLWGSLELSPIAG